MEPRDFRCSSKFTTIILMLGNILREHLKWHILEPEGWTIKPPHQWDILWRSEGDPDQEPTHLAWPMHEVTRYVGNGSCEARNGQGEACVREKLRIAVCVEYTLSHERSLHAWQIHLWVCHADGKVDRHAFETAPSRFCEPWGLEAVSLDTMPANPPRSTAFWRADVDERSEIIARRLRAAKIRSERREYLTQLRNKNA